MQTIVFFRGIMATFTSQVSNALPQWFPGSNEDERVRNLALLVSAIALSCLAIIRYKNLRNTSGTPAPQPNTTPISKTPVESLPPTSNKKGLGWKFYTISLIATASLAGYTYSKDGATPPPLPGSKDDAPLPGSQPRSQGESKRNHLKRIWQQTEQDLQAKCYKRGEERTELNLSSCDKTEVSIQTEPRYPSPGPITQQTCVEVVNKDALDVAIELQKQGLNPLLLNPANAKNLGGGYTNGASAMEEDLCRRSALSTSLKHVQVQYPLINKCVYAPDVPVFRHGNAQDYAYLEEPIPVSMISIAAINLQKEHPSPDEFYHQTTKLIYNQLRLADIQGHDALVLTAFGCGAFHNDPEEVAKIYHHVITVFFPHQFAKITFAILDDHNTGKTHNPRGNFTPFQELFPS